MKTMAACLFALAVLAARPAAAQSSGDPAGFSEPSDVGFRGFFIATEQSFAAKTTVDAAFDSSTAAVLRRRRANHVCGAASTSSSA